MSTFEASTVSHLRKSLSPQTFAYLSSILTPPNNISQDRGNVKVKTIVQKKVSSPNKTSCQGSVCQKILKKAIVPSPNSNHGTSCHGANKSLQMEHTDGHGVYEPLIGKINWTAKFHTGLCQLSEVITNPLYIQYDPRGHSTTDDELGLEVIKLAVDKFNHWTETLAGDKVAGLSDRVFEILRAEIEIPDEDELAKIQKIIKILTQ